MSTLHVKRSGSGIILKYGGIKLALDTFARGASTFLSHSHSDHIVGIQKAAPRIIGPVNLKITAENTEKIDIYVNDEIHATIDKIPYEITLDLNQGLHTITTIAYDADGDVSRDILDVFILF